MPTTPQEIDCPECDEGRIEYGSGDSNGHTEACKTCDGSGRVTVIPCPLHGMDGYTATDDRTPTLACMPCAEGEWYYDEICNLNHLIKANEVTLPAELIALAVASARGEDYDFERFNVLYQGAR